MVLQELVNGKEESFCQLACDLQCDSLSVHYTRDGLLTTHVSFFSSQQQTRKYIKETVDVSLMKIASALKKCPSVKELVLHASCQANQAAEVIECLAGSAVETIDFSFNLRAKDEWSQEILAKIAEKLRLTHIHTIRLIGNQISSYDIDSFIKALALTSVVRVDLRHNQIDSLSFLQDKKSLMSQYVPLIKLESNPLPPAQQEQIQKTVFHNRRLMGFRLSAMITELFGERNENVEGFPLELVEKIIAHMTPLKDQQHNILQWYDFYRSRPKLAQQQGQESLVPAQHTALAQVSSLKASARTWLKLKSLHLASSAKQGIPIRKIPPKDRVSEVLEMFPRFKIW